MESVSATGPSNVYDPVSFLRRLDEARGGELDAIGEMLGNRRKATLHMDYASLCHHSNGIIGAWENVETDDEYRSRLIDAVCTCRNGVHVLGRDPATWARCQCGERPGVDDWCPTGKHRKVDCDCLVEEAERIGSLAIGQPEPRWGPSSTYPTASIGSNLFDQYRKRIGLARCDYCGGDSGAHPLTEFTRITPTGSEYRNACSGDVCGSLVRKWIDEGKQMCAEAEHVPQPGDYVRIDWRWCATGFESAWEHTAYVEGEVVRIHRPKLDLVAEILVDRSNKMVAGHVAGIGIDHGARFRRIPRPMVTATPPEAIETDEVPSRFRPGASWTPSVGAPQWGPSSTYPTTRAASDLLEQVRKHIEPPPPRAATWDDPIAEAFADLRPRHDGFDQSRIDQIKAMMLATSKRH